MTLQERLILENQLLERDGLSQFQVYRNEHRESFYLWGAHNTNCGKTYTIWSPLPTLYPDRRPPVYIHIPNPLPSYVTSQSLNSYGLSHNMHTLKNGPHREVQICHWRDDRWHSAITLNKVMIKVVL